MLPLVEVMQNPIAFAFYTISLLKHTHTDIYDDNDSGMAQRLFRVQSRAASNNCLRTEPRECLLGSLAAADNQSLDRTAATARSKTIGPGPWCLFCVQRHSALDRVLCKYSRLAQVVSTGVRRCVPLPRVGGQAGHASIGG